MYEVEQKFSISNKTTHIDENLLIEIGCQPSGRCQQIDWYLVHPTRDFSVTDEALRIRSVQIDDQRSQTILTYKGPRQQANTTGRDFKTRRELEFAIQSVGGTDDAEPEQLAQLFGALGFQKRFQVGKTRHTFVLQKWERQFEFALDDVTDLGRFLEIQTMVKQDAIEGAQQQICELANQIQLHSPITASYLELLLSRDNVDDSPESTS